MCDRHVVKMSLEYTQILSTAHFVWNSPVQHNVYKPTHLHHPCVKWALHNNSNYQTLLILAIYTLAEYSYRYGKRHKCLDLYTDTGLYHNPITEESTLTLPPMCVHMDGHINPSNWIDVVKGYRDYYNYKYNSNREEVYWRKKREQPDWVKEYEI
jgi:hypothetical protein